YTRQPVGEIAAFQRPGIRIIGVKSGNETIRTGISEQTLKKGDTLIIMASTSELLTLSEQEELRVGMRRGSDSSSDKVVVEAIVAPRGASTGQRIADLTLGRRFGVRVLGAHRHR